MRIAVAAHLFRLPCGRGHAATATPVARPTSRSGPARRRSNISLTAPSVMGDSFGGMIARHVAHGVEIRSLDWLLLRACTARPIGARPSPSAGCPRGPLRSYFAGQAGMTTEIAVVPEQGHARRFHQVCTPSTPRREPNHS